MAYARRRATRRSSYRPQRVASRRAGTRSRATGRTSRQPTMRLVIEHVTASPVARPDIGLGPQVERKLPAKAKL